MTDRYENIRKVLAECRDIAMEWTMRGRIPECGKFGEIAQNLDAVCAELENSTQWHPITDAGRDQLAAEIEALRAEVAAQRTRADAMAGEAIKHEARADRLAEALIAWHKQATDKGRREREESPGHSHAVLGVWDSDNGKYAGVECAQCALWFEATRLRAAQENDDA